MPEKNWNSAIISEKIPDCLVIQVEGSVHVPKYLSA